MTSDLEHIAIAVGALEAAARALDVAKEHADALEGGSGGLGAGIDAALNGVMHARTSGRGALMPFAPRR